MRIHRDEDPAAAEAARKAILADDRLSFAAQGLLLQILEHAPEWDINAEGISRRAKAARGDGGENVPRVRAMFRELAATGYLVRSMLQADRRGSRLDFFETPREVKPADPMKIEPIPTPRTPLDRKGSVVYLIGSAGSSLVKIGTTTDIKARLKGIQTSSPVRLEVLWTHDGDYELEDLLHERYRRRRVQGEWFDFGSSDPVALLTKYVRRLDNAHYEEVEARLRAECVKQGLPVSYPR